MSCQIGIHLEWSFLRGATVTKRRQPGKGAIIREKVFSVLSQLDSTQQHIAQAPARATVTADGMFISQVRQARNNCLQFNFLFGYKWYCSPSDLSLSSSVSFHFTLWKSSTSEMKSDQADVSHTNATAQVLVNVPCTPLHLREKLLYRSRLLIERILLFTQQSAGRD
jgi:hypothetical protein